MEKIWEDIEWAEEFYPELQKKYHDEWIAIFNKEVISSGKNLGTVEDEARKKVGKTEFYTIFIESGAAFY